MKLIVCILALLVAAQAGPVKKDFGVAVKYMYDKVVKAFPCGIAGSGPLDPFVLEEEYTKEPMVYKGDDYDISFHIKFLEVRGLKSFKIHSSEYNHETKEFKLFVVPPQLYVKSNYSWSSNFKFEDKMKMFHMEDGFVDAHIKFPQEKLGVSWVFVEDNEKLGVKNMKFHEPVLDWHKEFSFLGEHYEVFVKEVKPLIEEIEGDMNKIMYKAMEEQMNKELVKYKDLDEVVDKMNKFAGDEHSGPFGEKLCVH